VIYSELEQIYSGKNNENIFSALWGWWFIDLPRKIIFIGQSYLLKLWRFFSIGILLKTLLSPWKRDIIDTRGLSLQERFQVWGMNLISRMIGFIIRFTTMIIGLICIILATLGLALFFLIMFFLPLFIILVIRLSI